MSEEKNSILENLENAMKDIHRDCIHPGKSQKCLEYKNTKDIPCSCDKIINIRQQIQWMAEK